LTSRLTWGLNSRSSLGASPLLDPVERLEPFQEAAAHLQGAVTASLPTAVLWTAAERAALPPGGRSEMARSFADIPHFPHREGGGREGPGGESRADPELHLVRLGEDRVWWVRRPLLPSEADSLADLAFPLRTLRLLGCDLLLLLGEAESLRPDAGKEELFLVDDHLNLLGGSPLVGPNLDDLGPRFPDLSEAYDPMLRDALLRRALGRGVPLARGVLAAIPETGSKIASVRETLRGLGADAVGRGVVPEVITARHMGMRALALCTLRDGAGNTQLAMELLSGLLAPSRTLRKD